MSDEAATTVGGFATTRLLLHVPHSGPWIVEADMAGDEPLSGRVVVQLLGSELIGTVQPTASGTFGLQRKVRIIAGAGGWQNRIPAKAYHNDAGVKASQVAQDAAAACGETLGTFEPVSARLGSDWVRTDLPGSTAASALEAAAGGLRWWVDYAGVTQVGARPQLTPVAGSYEVLSFDPRAGRAEIAIDALSAVSVGSLLTERLDAPARVAAFELLVEQGKTRLTAWCAEDAGVTEGADLLVKLIERVIARKLLGVYRYRVVSLVGDRLQLQAVTKAHGVPDLPVVSMWPGLAGSHATLALGTQVLIQFEAGDRAVPLVTGFVGRGGPFDVPEMLELGGSSGKPSARSGDTVEIQLPPMAFTGSVGGAPASGVLSALIPKTLGSIVTGSSRVKVAG